MIPPYRVFDEYSDDYKRWFEGHATVHTAQIRMLREAVPRTGHGLKVGIGSGRFAAPLYICYGIDPSRGFSGSPDAKASKMYRLAVRTCPSRQALLFRTGDDGHLFP